jgi:hypothetical protein
MVAGTHKANHHALNVAQLMAVTDHSGGYRIEPLWPDGVLVGLGLPELRGCSVRRP